MPAEDDRFHDWRAGAVLCLLYETAACLYAVLRAHDSLAAAGTILADVWLSDVKMPVIDCLGEEFLQYVKDDMAIAVKDGGIVEVEDKNNV